MAKFSIPEEEGRQKYFNRYALLLVIHNHVSRYTLRSIPSKIGLMHSSHRLDFVSQARGHSQMTSEERGREGVAQILTQ